MASFEVKIDLSGLMAISPAMRAGIYQQMESALEHVAITGARRWREAAKQAPLWGDEDPKGEQARYVASIKYRLIDKFNAEIYSDYKYAEDIESGRPARDLKRMLQTSVKVRLSAKGVRYLYIPFRHNTPGKRALTKPMPKEVYKEAQKLSLTRIVGEGSRMSGQGLWDIRFRAGGETPGRRLQLVRQRKYEWGDSLPAGLAPKLKPEHKTDPYAGMYRFDTSSGKQKSSAYLTFRTMSEKSTGWIVPPKPGLWIARTVAQGLQADGEKVFAEALLIA